MFFYSKRHLQPWLFTSRSIGWKVMALDSYYQVLSRRVASPMPHGGLSRGSLPHNWPSSFSLLLQQNGGTTLWGTLGALGVLCERRAVTEHTASKAKSSAERQAAPSSPLWVPTFPSGGGGEEHLSSPSIRPQRRQVSAHGSIAFSSRPVCSRPLGHISWY